MRSPSSPLQRIGMGVVFLLLSVRYESSAGDVYDAIPDPIGWLFILAGLKALRSLDQDFRAAFYATCVATLASFPLWLPQVSGGLSIEGQWFTSLPQIAAIALTCRATAVAARPHDAGLERTFNLLALAQASLAVLPPVVLTVGNENLAAGTQLYAAIVLAATAWSCFSHHRREWLGGPGPLEIDPETGRARR